MLGIADGLGRLDGTLEIRREDVGDGADPASRSSSEVATETPGLEHAVRGQRRVPRTSNKTPLACLYTSAWVWTDQSARENDILNAGDVVDALAVADEEDVYFTHG